MNTDFSPVPAGSEVQLCSDQYEGKSLTDRVYFETMIRRLKSGESGETDFRVWDAPTMEDISHFRKGNKAKKPTFAGLSPGFLEQNILPRIYHDMPY